MQKKLLQKLATIALLSFMLLIPLSMIEAQIGARSARQADVKRNIAESAAGPQTMIGPILAVRYRERVERREKDEKRGHETVRQEIVDRTLLLPPQKLDIAGAARVETRSRGLYRAQLYHLALQLNGSAAIPPRLGLDARRAIVDAEAFLVFGLGDLRGVENDPEVTVNGQVRHFAAGTAELLAGSGLHISLGSFDPATGGAYHFGLPLNLTGSERLALAPTANDTRLALKSDWPHPSFQGRFLPTQRTVTQQGFEAQWQVSHLARNFDNALRAGAGSGETLDVSFIDPVNVYLKSERAVKYGLLFVVLTFAAFFLTEVMRRLAIHPMQYLLVGLALAIFFLLLIALSEHLNFMIAYGVSATACVTLIGVYLAGVLGSLWRGMAFGAGIAALYGVLYGVLLSEDNALLMGAVLLFAALGATMLATRRIDWYRLGAHEPLNEMQA